MPSDSDAAVGMERLDTEDVPVHLRAAVVAASTSNPKAKPKAATNPKPKAKGKKSVTPPSSSDTSDSSATPSSRSRSSTVESDTGSGSDSGDEDALAKSSAPPPAAAKGGDTSDVTSSSDASSDEDAAPPSESSSSDGLGGSSDSDAPKKTKGTSKKKPAPKAKKPSPKAKKATAAAAKRERTDRRTESSSDSDSPAAATDTESSTSDFADGESDADKVPLRRSGRPGSRAVGLSDKPTTRRLPGLSDLRAPRNHAELQKQDGTARAILHAIDASRPLLCILTVFLSIAFTLGLFYHIPLSENKNETPDPNSAQPLFALPSVLVFIHGLAAYIGTEGCVRIVAPLTRDRRCFYAIFRTVGLVCAVVAPVVGWVAWKALPGPSIRDVMCSGFAGLTKDMEERESDGIVEMADREGATWHDDLDAAAVEVVPLFQQHKNEEEELSAAMAGSLHPSIRIVLSSVWARVAIAAAAMEPREIAGLFTFHAAALGNGLIVLCTIALAAPDGSHALPVHVRALGVSSVVAAVLYQASVFVPETFARPPPMALLFLLCFTHDVANMIGALSCLGTCEGSSCVSLAVYGFTYTVSPTSLAVLSSLALILPLAGIAIAVGNFLDFFDMAGGGKTGLFVALSSCVLQGVLLVPVLLALIPAVLMCVPCLSLVAAVVIGLGPRSPAAAAEQTLLHVFCDEVNAAFMRAAALVGPGSAAESVPLPPICNSSILCHGPTAAEIHILQHRASQHLGYAPDQPRKIVTDSLTEKFAVSMAEAAVVLTPHPTPAALPADVDASPMAYLSEHLADAEIATLVERRAPLAMFMDAAGMCPASTGTANSLPWPADRLFRVEQPHQAPPAPPAPMVVGSLHRPPHPHQSFGATLAASDRDDCHIDLASETYDHALQGDWRWLLRFAWRRRSFAPAPGHAIPAFFVGIWHSCWGDAVKFGAGATLAALLLSRPVLFIAPLLEPVFNTNVPTMAYVCIAVRAVCCVGLALIAPSLYRTVCRTAAFSAVHGPKEAPDRGLGEAMEATARCISDAYVRHLPAVLRAAVPHHVVPHMTIGNAVVPFLSLKQLK